MENATRERDQDQNQTPQIKLVDVEITDENIA